MKHYSTILSDGRYVVYKTVNENLEGRAIVYYDSNKIKSIFYIENDSIIGRTYNFYKSQRPVNVEEYVGGRLHGRSYIFFPDGKIKSITTYKRGVKDGPFWSFYANGNVETSCTYVRGFADGDVYVYHRQYRGVVQRKVNYCLVNGVTYIGGNTFYDKNGAITRRANILDVSITEADSAQNQACIKVVLHQKERPLLSAKIIPCSKNGYTYHTRLKKDTFLVQVANLRAGRDTVCGCLVNYDSIVVNSKKVKYAIYSRSLYFKKVIN